MHLRLCWHCIIRIITYYSQVCPCSSGTRSSVFKLYYILFLFIALVQQGTRCWKDCNFFPACQSSWKNMLLLLHSIPLPIPSHSRYILQSNIRFNNPVASIGHQAHNYFAFSISVSLSLFKSFHSSYKVETLVLVQKWTFFPLCKGKGSWYTRSSSDSVHYGL